MEKKCSKQLNTNERDRDTHPVQFGVGPPLSSLAAFLWSVSSFSGCTPLQLREGFASRVHAVQNKRSCTLQ